VSSARGRFGFRHLARAGVKLGLAGMVMLVASNSLQSAIADGDTRTLTMHHVHTGESITITYKRDGEYVPAALKKLDWFLRDWRRNEETRMDPRLFDVLWQVYRETDATKPIEIICGYRSPRTNKMLRARSGGVARYSQHVLGRAIDFFIPGVHLAKLRAVGLQLQRGGVGFYPRSGSPFVHMDVGSVRHWPGISRQQLVKIFPHGRTVHIPSDGRPLRGYAEALAMIERRGNVPNARSLKAARAAGLITAKEERVAELVGQGRLQKLAALIKSGRDNGVAKGHEAPIPTAVASLNSIKKTPKERPAQIASAAPVPLPHARPQLTLASARSKPAAQPMVTASASNLFDTRGYWRRPIDASPVPAKASPFDIADIDPAVTGSTGDAPLAYASITQTPAATRVRRRPMGMHLHARLPRFVGTAMADTLSEPILAEAKSLLGTPMAIGGQRLDSPWMRAAMLTPSVAEAMLVTRLGDNNPRLLQDLLYKPARSVMMIFSADPQHGMVTDHFTGNAVVFLATTSFVPRQTASLQ
jgi:uncharacterized protein YcbK (DUF882 family)